MACEPILFQAIAVANTSFRTACFIDGPNEKPYKNRLQGKHNTMNPPTNLLMESSYGYEPRGNEQAMLIGGLDWVTQSEWPASPSVRASAVKVVDLFCSCGGMTLGVWEGSRLSNRRIDVRLAVDLMPEPIKVYQANFSDVAEAIRTDDVSRIFDGRKGQSSTSTERYWKGRVDSLDLLVAGPPCQGHSDLNNSTRRSDPRNALYLRVVRAAELLEPRVVIVENVPAVQHDKGAVVQIAEKWLAEMGYHVSSAVLQFSRFGVPQSRKRHILIAIKDHNFELSELEDISEPDQSIGVFLSGLEKSANTNGLMSTPGRMTKLSEARVKYLFDHDLHNLPNKKRPPCHRDKEHAYVSMYGRMHWDKPAQTVTSGFGSMGQGRYVHPKERRLITPHEAARLQGIPDFFDFSSVSNLTGLREMIANAVPPQFTANLVARLIQKNVF